ncbi:hypothetical protein NDU88_010320 [Pleurodeles waltl]|uniref:Uncharacterized protein n=1 Tax=Pleurodeles waltl TaxID=8319 RepID=A0AAV7QZW6_PLEWA|nr:hypothetical protein NDU88_010320 [Pleurodeles waltl]
MSFCCLSNSELMDRGPNIGRAERDCIALSYYHVQIGQLRTHRHIRANDGGLSTEQREPGPGANSSHGQNSGIGARTQQALAEKTTLGGSDKGKEVIKQTFFFTDTIQEMSQNLPVYNRPTFLEAIRYPPLPYCDSVFSYVLPYLMD